MSREPAATSPASDAAAALDRLCRNCGAAAPGAYCAACGQDTRERLPTFGQFMRDATGRYVALDGKLWKTLAALLFRPGFLTREYVAGRRRRYIGPARLFLVSSLVLFAALRFATESLETDSVMIGDPQAATKARTGAGNIVTLDENLTFRLADLPQANGLLSKPIARFNSLTRAQKLEQILQGALRYGPYAMFVLLPAFALLLKLLYLGRRRRHPARPRLYGEHLVFAAHNHAFLFALGTLMVVLPPGYARLAAGLWAVAYLTWSMHAVYGGSWTGIAARGATLAVVHAILFGVVTVGLLIAAVLLR